MAIAQTLKTYRWRALGLLVASLFLAVALLSTVKRVAPLNWAWYGTTNLDGDGIGLGGYDAVAYFDGKKSLGRSEHSVKHEGATYWSPFVK